jgi:hypothetical protein
MTLDLRNSILPLAFCLTFVSCMPARAVLLASYNFENNLLDSSGNGYHGAFMGSASIVVDPVRGNVLNIPNNGLDHGVNIDAIKPIPNFPAQTSITLSGWYKRSADPGGEYRYVANLGQNGDNPIATLGVRGSDTVTGYIESNLFGGNSDQVNVYGSTAIEGGASTWRSWHHLAIVYDRSTDLAHTYVDGVHDGSTSLSLVSNSEAFNWTAASIGRGPAGSSSAVGLIDDVRVFTHALSAAEIANLAEMDFPALRAIVNRSTGEIVLESSGTAAAKFDSYQLTSPSHSLNPSTWSSLSDQNFQPIGPGIDQRWREMGGSDTQELGEVFLTAESTLAPNTTRSIGMAYNNAINGEDLLFQYHAPGGDVVEGEVSYIGVAPPQLNGDFNNDGVVDAADYVVWRNNLGGDDWVLNGNGDNSGTVGVGDYSLWKTSFGNTSPGALAVAANSVPEPATVGLVSLALVGLLLQHRRRRSPA